MVYACLLKYYKKKEKKESVNNRGKEGRRGGRQKRERRETGFTETQVTSSEEGDRSLSTEEERPSAESLGG